jgi:hypothetical protein
MVKPDGLGILFVHIDQSKIHDHTWSRTLDETRGLGPKATPEQASHT